MTTFRNITLVLSILFLLTNCNTEMKFDVKDKIFHAGPANSGFGVIYWVLYSGNRYQFCDGDFTDYGCNIGLYTLSGDTVILNGLKKHAGIPTNKFIIRRYCDMDSSYWAWKYPNNYFDWKTLRHTDSLIGATGDVFPLDENNKIKRERDNYFLIRLDRLNTGR